MSAEGRGAFLTGEKAYASYDEAATTEAMEAAIKLHNIAMVVDEVSKRRGSRSTVRLANELAHSYPSALVYP